MTAHPMAEAARRELDEIVQLVERCDPDAVALFVAGRIGVDDDRLEVEDSAHALAHLKRLFPGP